MRRIFINRKFFHREIHKGEILVGKGRGGGKCSQGGMI